MPTNKHSCYPLIHTIDGMRHKCSKSCNCVCNGEHLNQKFGPLFVPSMNYQICSAGHLMFSWKVPYSGTQTAIMSNRTIVNSNNEKKIPKKSTCLSTKDRIQNIFAKESSQKSYRKLGKTQRYIKVNALVDMILANVISKDEIKDSGLDYILRNNQQIGTDIAFFLEILKLCLEK